MIFSTRVQNKLGRSGEFATRAGVIRTPTFMPVGTRGSVKSVPMSMLDTISPDVVLANTYHLHLKPGEKVVKDLGGLHSFMNRAEPILTDSGGFQVFSLSGIRTISEEGVEFTDPTTGDRVFISPEDAIRIQIDLGADIIMAFDDLTGLGEGERSRTKEAFDRTHRWLERCLTEFKKLTADMEENERPLLFGISQGGLDKQLRIDSLQFVQSTNVDGIAIGGLSVGESKQDMYEVLDYLAPIYDENRPRYLMGVGDPPDLRHAFSRGIDMADCVIPSRNARHGSVWVDGDKKLNLKSAIHERSREPIEPGCACSTCTAGYSRGWLRHQFKVNDPVAGTLATIHNIHYLQEIAKSFR